jgi:hypothetical protein
MTHSLTGYPASNAVAFIDPAQWSYSRLFGSDPDEREVADLARERGYLPRHQAEASCHGSEVWLPQGLRQSEYTERGRGKFSHAPRD